MATVYPELWVDINDKSSLLSVIGEILFPGKVVELDVKILEGGISNLLWRLSWAADEAISNENITKELQRSVLVRVFGESNETYSVCNRTTENRIYRELRDRHKLGSGVVAEFKNGRIEHFFEDMTTLEPLDMLDTEVYTPAVAKLLGKFHNIRLESAFKEFLLGSGGSGDGDALTTDAVPQNMFWPQLMDDWLVKAKSVSFEGKKVQVDMNYLATELEYWQNWFAKPSKEISNDTNFILALDYWKTIGLCHNDLLAANLLVKTSKSKEDGKVVLDQFELIDFEYSNYSYVGLDVCNFFNAIIEGMYIVEQKFAPETWFPKREVLTTFLTNYLEGRHDMKKTSSDSPVSMGDGKGGDAREKSSDGESVEAQAPSDLQPLFNDPAKRNQVLLSESGIAALLTFCPLAELRWIVWAVVQSAAASVDYDYLDYANVRLEKGYKYYKQKVSASLEK